MKKMPEDIINLCVWTAELCNLKVLHVCDYYVTAGTHTKWNPTEDLNQSRLVVAEIEERGLETMLVVKLQKMMANPDYEDFTAFSDFWNGLTATPLQICKAAFSTLTGL